VEEQPSHINPGTLIRHEDLKPQNVFHVPHYRSKSRLREGGTFGDLDWAGFRTAAGIAADEVLGVGKGEKPIFMEVESAADRLLGNDWIYNGQTPELHGVNPEGEDEKTDRGTRINEASLKVTAASFGGAFGLVALTQGIAIGLAGGVIGATAGLAGAVLWLRRVG
jgi:hypothetical protein